MHPLEVVEFSNPRSLLEEQESEPTDSQKEQTEMATAFGRILAWMLDGKEIRQVGFRVFITAHMIRPDLINGMSFEKMAKLLGQGRSSAHNLSKDFALVFGVRGINSRSVETREKYKEAWIRANTSTSQASRELSRPQSATNHPAPCLSSGRTSRANALFRSLH